MAGSPLDAHVGAIRLWLLDGKTNVEIVQLLKEAFSFETSEASVRRCVDRNESLQSADEQRRLKWDQDRLNDDLKFKGAEPEGQEETTEECKITSFVVSNKPLSEEDLIRIYKIDLDRWDAKDFKLNSWPGPIGNGQVTRYYQSTLYLKKRVAMGQIVVPSLDLPMPERPKAPTKLHQSFLWVGFYDPHAPYYDRGLFELAKRWLAHNRPDRGLFGGDGPDYPTISRHDNSLVYNARVNECNRTWFEFLHGIRFACEETAYDYVDGNHDDRVKKALLAAVPELAEVTHPTWPGEDPDTRPIWHPAKLFDLDRLGINYVGSNGSYAYGRVRITDGLIAMHGNFTGPNAKAKTADKYNCNVIFGHLHQYGVHNETRWNADTGGEDLIEVIQAPTMAQTSEGLGYDTAPDWTRGFVVVRVHKPGVYTHSVARYKDGVLVWEDQEYVL